MSTVPDYRVHTYRPRQPKNLIEIPATITLNHVDLTNGFLHKHSGKEIFMFKVYMYCTVSLHTYNITRTYSMCINEIPVDFRGITWITLLILILTCFDHGSGSFSACSS